MQSNRRFPGQGLNPRDEKSPARPIMRDPQRYAPPEAGRRWNWLGITVIILACAVATIILAGVLGYVDGVKDRKENLRAQALEHYRLGVAHMNDAEYELAEAEFEESIRMQPDLQQSWEQLREARARQGSVPTPTSVAVFVPTPAASPKPAPTEALPVPTPTDSAAAKAALLAEAEALYGRGAYLDAVAKVEQLLRQDPNYNRPQVETLLFNCYSREGLALVEQDRFEEALRYLDLALKLKPADASLKAERDLAAGYSAALSFWDADWEAAVRAFGDLVALRPTYKDVANRYYNAHVELAGMLGEAGRWCEAADWYEKALQLRADANVAARRDQMQANCANNVPPPTLPPDATGAPASIGTPAAGATPDTAPEALRALGLQGTLYYAINDAVRKAYAFYRINADGTGKAELILGVHQPQVNHAGNALIVRARSNVKTLGLYRLDLTGAVPPPLTQVTSHVDDLYATFSPDDGQILFTSNRMSQRLWTLFVGASNGPSDLRTVLEGQTPAWGPAGDLIAYKGCDERGNACGLWTATSAGANKKAIVQDPSAGFPAWSPDGKRLIFMSNRDGNWEIYLVNADGSGLRRLTQSNSSEGMPTWSPDGIAIAYMSDRGGQWGVYLQRLDDGRVARLINLDTTYEDWMMERVAWGPRR